jgi:hypothetical protein
MKAETPRPSYVHRIEDKKALRAATTPDGRYIPHSGGLMGWFENSGVPKREQNNNYRFHTAVDAEAVRGKLFERWNDGEKVDRRVYDRRDVTREVTAELAWHGKAVPAVLRDYSQHGFKMQVLDEEPALAKGDLPLVRIFSGPDRTRTAFEIQGRVMWAAKGGSRRTVWSMGIMFLDLPEGEAERLAQFLG